jgi:hypothetical protein
MKSNQQEDRPKRSLLRPWHLTGVLGSSAVWLAVLVGCQSASSDKSEDTPTRLQTLHGLLSEYLMEERPALSKRPDSPSRPNAERFKEFVTSLPPHRIGDTEAQKLLVSPRDGEPFVINNDMPSSGHIPAIWEQTGVNGRRYVVYADDNVEEVDEETFTKIKPEK